MRATWLSLTVLALAGCERAPERPAITRPEWRSAAVDGIAPLMSPAEVEAALGRGGYVQVPCREGEKMPVRPLYAGEERPCYHSLTRPMDVSLYFLELNEGRRLAVVFFRQPETLDTDDAKRLAGSGALARRLRARFGKPDADVDDSPDYRSFYWNRPGGQREQPDTISTTVGRDFTPNITMTSAWAYGEVRPTP